MCLPPETSVPVLPSFRRVQGYGARQQRVPYYPQGVQSSPPDYLLDDFYWASLGEGDAEFCAAGIKLPLLPAGVPTLGTVSDEPAGELPVDSLEPATPNSPKTLGARGPCELPNNVGSASEILKQHERLNDHQASPGQQLLGTSASSCPAPSAPVFMDVSPSQPCTPRRPLGFEEKTVQLPTSIGKSEAELVAGNHEVHPDPATSSSKSEPGTKSTWLESGITKGDAGVETSSAFAKKGATSASDTSSGGKLPNDLTKHGPESKTRPPQAEHSSETMDVDKCTDDEMKPVVIDEKRKRRMLSNRASAQRSRQRRQDRLDQLEILTAQLRLENASLLGKVRFATQLAKNFEAENKNLTKNLEKLTQELLEVSRKLQPLNTPNLYGDSTNSSQQITCTSDSEVGEGVNPQPSAKLEEILCDDGKDDGKDSMVPGHTKIMEHAEHFAGDSSSCEEVSPCCLVPVSTRKRTFGMTAPLALAVSISPPVSSNTMGYENASGLISPMSPPQLCSTLSAEPASRDLTISVADEQFLFEDVCDSMVANLDGSMEDEVLDSIEDEWLEGFVAQYLIG